MMKRYEIQVLLKAGFAQAKIAELAGVSERTVRAVADEDPITEIDEQPARAHRGIGRPSKAEPFRAFVAEVRKEEPELMSLEVLRASSTAPL